MKTAPLAEQIAAIERLMPNETDAHAFDCLRFASVTLRFLSEWADPLRSLVSYLRRVGPAAGAIRWEDLMPSEAEAAAIIAAPGVAELLREFPGARIVGVTEAAPIAAPEPRDEEEQVQ